MGAVSVTSIDSSHVQLLFNKAFVLEVIRKAENAVQGD